MGFRANFMPACFCGEIYFYFIENQSDVNCHRTCVPMWTVYLDIGLSWFSLIPPADRFEYWATDVQHHGHFAIGLSGVAHGPLTRYVKLHVVHAPGMPGTFSLPPLVSDPDMHHVTHVPWCMSRSLTCGFLWSQWRGKCSRHSWRMCNPHFYVSGKRPMVQKIGSCNLWML